MFSTWIARLGLLWTVLTVTGASWASPQDPGADMPIWPFVVGAIAAVGVAAIWQTRRRP